MRTFVFLLKKKNASVLDASCAFGEEGAHGFSRRFIRGFIINAQEHFVVLQGVDTGCSHLMKPGV